jgi:hypothetical protein
MPDLTGPEMDKRIALALGYKVTPNNIWSTPPDKHGTVTTGPMAKIVPQYHRNLNATWEARQSFDQHEKKAYQTHLVKLGGTLLDATPRDHAEAWLVAKRVSVPAEVAA